MAEIVKKDVGLILIDPAEETRYMALLERKEEIDKELQELKKMITERLNEENIKQFKTDNMTITIIDEQMKEYFDTDKFREENPKLYDRYVKFKKTSAQTRILVNKKRGAK